MSQKAEKPVLSGQRMKPRKRDEKGRYNPVGFRDAIISELNNCGNDFVAISRCLDNASNKLDYHRYGECLFDILIAGGILVSGGTLLREGEAPYKTDVCIFSTPDDIHMETMKNWEQVFTKLIRRFKYLKNVFHDEITKILLSIKCFTVAERKKLAVMHYLWCANGDVPCNVLLVLSKSPHLVKENVALDFLIDMLACWHRERGADHFIANLGKCSIPSHLMDFVPDTTQSCTYFHAQIEKHCLTDILTLYNKRYQQRTKDRLYQFLCGELLPDNFVEQDVITELKAAVERDKIAEDVVIDIIWQTVMKMGSWSKKEELIAEQSTVHLKKYMGLFVAFTKSPYAESTLLLRVQEYCYANMKFMKAFQRIVIMFYQSDVLTEDVIISWSKKKDNNMKGKSVFVNQLSKFIEWLQNAEEESSNEEEDDYDDDKEEEVVAVDDADEIKTNNHEKEGGGGVDGAI